MLLFACVHVECVVTVYMYYLGTQAQLKIVQEQDRSSDTDTRKQTEKATNGTDTKKQTEKATNGKRKAKNQNSEAPKVCTCRQCTVYKSPTCKHALC